MEEKSLLTMQSLKDNVGKFLLLEDDGVIDATIGTVIANKLDLDAVWLMVVGASSTGKTELLNPLFGLPFIIPISDLTVNTFASGFNMGGGKQASLLMRYQNGILVFKDFTSILSKSRETRDTIMSQMREIYEGKYNKQTGTGQEINWTGKMGCLAAATDAVYIELANSTQMGQRFIYYNMQAPNRRKAAKRAQQNASRSAEMREALTTQYTDYITHVIDNINEGRVEYEAPAEIEDEMLDVADFSCLARSPVHTDFKTGHIDSKPDKEGPGRVVKQLMAMSGAFMAINQSERLDSPGLEGATKNMIITPHQRRVITRCAYDSIPSMRRHVLKLLAKYRGGVNTAAAAVELNMPSESLKKYLYQINALEICDRKLEGGNKGHRWKMKDEAHRKVVCEVEGIVALDDELIKNQDDEESDLAANVSFDPDLTEHERAAQEEFDNF